MEVKPTKINNYHWSDLILKIIQTYFRCALSDYILNNQSDLPKKNSTLSINNTSNVLKEDIKKIQKKRKSKKKKKENMSPISDKNSPIIINENIKENISNSKLNGRIPEILDFRESWLKEVELYNKEQQITSSFLVEQNHNHTSERLLRNGIKEINKAKYELKKRRSYEKNDKIRPSRKKIVENEEELVFKRSREDSGKRNNDYNKIKHEGKKMRTKSESPTLPTPKLIVNPCHKNLINNKSEEIIKTSSTKSQQDFNIDTNASQSKIKNEIFNSINNYENYPFVQIDTNVSQKNGDVSSNKEHDIFVNKNNKDSCENKSDDEGSFIDDEDDFGIIDDDEISFSSSDSEDEYKGFAYYLHDKEEKEEKLTSSLYFKNDYNYYTPEIPLSPSLFPNVPPYLAFSSHIKKGPSMPNNLHRILCWKVTPIMPRIVKRVIANSGIRLIKKANDWVGTWEKHMKSPLFNTVRPYQKFNHLPGTFRIGRKDSVEKNLRKSIAKFGRKEFGIMQRTFILPQDLPTLRKVWPRFAKRNTKWIIKPPASARGSGIKVVNKWSEIPKNNSIIVQRYIERPFLINGSKFDLRLYVLVTSINPLRIYMHTEGLARFASVQYSNKLETLDDRCMHLTNYSINKLSATYSKNEDINACQGHKWTLKSLWKYFENKGINTKRLWSTLRNLVIKTLLTGECGLNNMYKNHVNSKYNCYELFGFDVLLDEELVPWLLEVNISPSLHSELPLDQHVKGPLIQAVLNTALYQIPAKMSKQQENLILTQYNLKGQLCHNPRLYVTRLTKEEIKKHNFYTGPTCESREEYLDTILDKLTPDDVRCLILAEDELAHSFPLERIFPGPNSYKYLDFTDYPRYYNRLLDAWETKYFNKRHKGIKLLQSLCRKGIHLNVPTEFLLKENTDGEINEIYQESCVELEKDIAKISIIGIQPSLKKVQSHKRVQNVICTSPIF